MQGVMDGVRVLEVAQFWFVPSAGAVLSDWGANVIKIEHPERGDGQRGLANAGISTEIAGVDFLVQQPNRGKRSVGLDFGTPEGLELLYRLAEQADVFLTNFLPDARARLKIDVEDIRARNPRIIYVRGHGQGARGPEAGLGGYDASAFWARAALEAFLNCRNVVYPFPPPPDEDSPEEVLRFFFVRVSARQERDARMARRRRNPPFDPRWRVARHFPLAMATKAEA